MGPTSKLYIGKIILFLLMFCGVFLALCSLASLSYIDGKKESNLPVVVRFDTMFKKMQSTFILGRANLSKLDTSISKMWDQYHAFVTFKVTATKDLEKSERQKFNLVADSMDRLFVKHMTFLSNEKNDYVVMYNKDLSVQQNLLLRLDEQFKQSSGELPSGLLSKYVERLAIFISGLPYEGEVSRNFNILDANYRLYFQAIKIANDKLLILHDELRARHDSIDNDLTPYLVIPTLPKEEQYRVVEYNSTDKMNEDLPPPPKLGEDWGIFADIIGWLVGPKNIDLLVLIGMLGFALFGSAITIFVSGNLGAGNTSVSQNLTLVVVRGFSAAIIVFLAIRGGLAIVNVGENNPNPILLFLFCFIGSVFSEPIWAWAQGRIGSVFQRPAAPVQPPLQTDGRGPNPEVQLDKPIFK